MSHQPSLGEQRLVRFWSGAIWLTLTFEPLVPVRDSDQKIRGFNFLKQPHSSLTIFQHQLSASHWSELKLRVAGDMTIPLGRQQKEQA